MEVTIKVQAPELAGAILALAAALTSGANAQQAIGAAKASSKKATAKEEAPVETPKPDATPTAPKAESPVQTTEAPTAPAVTDTPTSTTASPSEVSVEQVRAKLAALSKDGKGSQVKELLSRHGASSVSTLKEDLYSVVLSECEAL
jgi:hypothetical protein